MVLTKRALAEHLRSFSEYLQRVGAELFQKAYKVHGIKDLSIQQLRYLEVIEGSPGRTPGALAREFAVTKPTVTNVVAGLERMGLVRRKKGTEDKRVSYLYPTERTRGVFAMRRGMYAQLASHVAGKLTKAETQELVRLLTKARMEEDTANE